MTAGGAADGTGQPAGGGARSWRRVAVRWALLLAVACGVAWGLTRLLLYWLGEGSPYRAEHAFLGVLLLLGYTWLLHRRGSRTAPLMGLGFFSLALLPAYAGTVFPDLDIALLGIGAHRNPLFHSALAYLLPLALLRRWLGPWGRAALIGLGVGLASHLLWDAVDYGDVRWIGGGTADRLWLVANGLACLVPPWKPRQGMPA